MSVSKRTWEQECKRACLLACLNGAGRCSSVSEEAALLLPSLEGTPKPFFLLLKPEACMMETRRSRLYNVPLWAR